MTERGDDVLAANLEASNDQMAAAISQGAEGIAGVQEANRRFHHELLRASGSPRLRTMLDAIIDMPIIVRSFYLYSRSELEQSLHHHKDLTLAVRAKDGELARQVMQLHLCMSYHRFMQRRREYAPSQQVPIAGPRAERRGR